MTPTLRALAVGAVVLATACGGASSPATNARKVIGVSLLTQTHAFYKSLEAGVREEAAAKGLDVVVVACEFDPAKQASQIEDFVAQHVAAILVAPCDSDAIVPALAGPERAGIPVFTADIAAHGGKVVSHVASDNVQGGALAADTLAGFLGGKGKVIIIDHPTVASVQDRVRGFEDAMKKYPGIAIIAKPSADGQRPKAAQVMEDMLQAHHDVAGVFGINDDSALGALAAVTAAGKEGKIVIVGYDATPEAREAMRRGLIYGDTIQYPRKMGELTINAVRDHFAGKKLPAWIPVETGVFTAAEAQKG